MNDTRPDEPIEPREDEAAAEGAAPAEPEIEIDAEAEPVAEAEPETEPPGISAPPPPEPEDNSRRGRGGTMLALLAFVVAAAAAGGAAYNWWIAQGDANARSELSAGLQARISDAASATDKRIAPLEQRLDSLENDVRSEQDQADDVQAQLKALRDRLASVVSETAGPERRPAIADVEHLLVIANRELTLAGNHRVALAALKEADDRLQRMDDPSLLPVRQSISDDIAAVEQAAAHDTEGLALRLGSLAGQIRGLPLKASLAPQPEEDEAADLSGWARFKKRIAELATSLFRVRKMDRPPAPLLSPEESFFLHRNVELDLKAARLAAMAGDQDNYAQSLHSARDAVSSYFLADDPAVKSFLSALDELASRKVTIRWPDITATLDLLRSSTEVPEAT